jgi:hypothetical protein
MVACAPDIAALVLIEGCAARRPRGVGDDGRIGRAALGAGICDGAMVFGYGQGLAMAPLLSAVSQP